MLCFSIQAIPIDTDTPKKYGYSPILIQILQNIRLFTDTDTDPPSLIKLLKE